MIRVGLVLALVASISYIDLEAGLECKVSSPDHVVCVMSCSNLGPDQSNYAWGVLELPREVTVVGLQNSWGVVAVAPEDNDVLWWSQDGMYPLEAGETGILTATLKVGTGQDLELLARVNTAWLWEEDVPGNNRETKKILLPKTFIPLVYRDPSRILERE